jgi:uncharacterized protein
LTKQQVIQLRDSAQLSANLPLSSAKLDGEVRSGRSIELALVRVGLSSTPVARIALPELSGECEGATHFVQSSTVGAFSMATGSIGQASAVAEMFGASGAAKSSSERKTLTNDGSLEACRKSDPDAAAPPAECRAPPQIELFSHPLRRAGGAERDEGRRSSPGPCGRRRERGAPLARHGCPGLRGRRWSFVFGRGRDLDA